MNSFPFLGTESNLTFFFFFTFCSTVKHDLSSNHFKYFSQDTNPTSSIPCHRLSKKTCEINHTPLQLLLYLERILMKFQNIGLLDWESLSLLNCITRNRFNNFMSPFPVIWIDSLQRNKLSTKGETKSKERKRKRSIYLSNKYLLNVYYVSGNSLVTVLQHLAK